MGDNPNPFGWEFLALKGAFKRTMVMIGIKEIHEVPNSQQKQIGKYTNPPRLKLASIISLLDGNSLYSKEPSSEFFVRISIKEIHKVHCKEE